MAEPISSVKQYFDTLGSRFRADAANGVDAVFQWQITGDTGGDYHAVIQDGAFELNEGIHDKPNVTIKISDENYVKLINGKLNGAMAVMTRKMKVSGNIVLAKKMEQLFPRS